MEAVYLLYWYKSTNTLAHSVTASGAWVDKVWAVYTLVVQRLINSTARHAVYLRYWYKSTNTDVKWADKVYSVYSLYWLQRLTQTCSGVCLLEDTSVYLLY